MQTNAEIASFLHDAGWNESVREDFPADFSTRRYARLTREGADPASAILMMAEKDHKTEIFVHLALVLRRLEIPVPQIYASDIPRDLALMEDFGSINLGARLDTDGERAGYDREIARILARLHDRFDQTMASAIKIPVFNAALFTDQATLFLDHYFKRVKGRPATAMERSGFVEAFHEVLAPLDAMPRSLMLRDLMPDNVMVLHKPLFGSTLGLLDFQDAGIGPIAYDLASWCEEVRRDGGLQRLDFVADSYCANRKGQERALLVHGAKIFLAQRHTRILGILAKLGKKEYASRVVRVLRGLLRETPLEPVRRWFESCAPLL